LFDQLLVEVFQFYTYESVHNHPRLDPEVELEQVSDGPIGVATVIRRLNSHSGIPVEGSMEVVKFEHNRSMSVIIHDGPVETRGLATFEAESRSKTTLNFDVEFPGMDDSMDTSMISSMIERSLGNMKRLIESEI
jgi:hypothetical protein